MSVAPPATRATTLDDITVVVPTIGRDSLRECLRAIASGTARPAQLIVVDQGTSANAAGWVRALARDGVAAEYIPSRETGAAAARNRGIERARTRFIAATDDDCIAQPDWLERLTERLRAHPGAIITGRVAALGSASSAPSTITDTAPAIHHRPRVGRDPLFSGNMGFAAELVERIGRMDEHPSLRHAEDAEWAYRALRAGVPIVYAPEVGVSHLGWRSEREMAETYRRYARSQGGFYGWHARRGDTFIARRAAFELVRAPWLVLRGRVTRNAELAAIGRATLTQLVPGMAAGWRRGAS